MNLFQADADAFWLQDVTSAVEDEAGVVSVLLSINVWVGTVQLVLRMPPINRHRAEISKMIV